MAGEEAKFLFRNLKSIQEQSYKDYEVIITDNSDNDNLKHVCSLFPDLPIKHSFESKRGAALNTNAGIKKAKGDLIKFLYMDDFFTHPNSLQEIVKNFKKGWLVTGCNHYDGEKTYNPHLARYDHKIFTGYNTIGAPSVLTIENKNPLLFDPTLTWLFDCDYYMRLYDRYSMPTIIDDINVTIGTGEHQATSWLGEKIKKDEEKYMYKKYAKRI
jgi:glycosyltransferase involved in cell wall biosynthesis